MVEGRGIQRRGKRAGSLAAEGRGIRGRGRGRGVGRRGWRLGGRGIHGRGRGAGSWGFAQVLLGWGR